MVDHDPRPLPIEEQVINDPRFTHLLPKDDYFSIITSLYEALVTNPSDLHAQFWIEYMRVKSDYIGWAKREFGRADALRVLATSEGIEHERLAIEATRSTSFEDEEVMGIREGLEGLNEGNVDEDLMFFFEVTDRMIEKGKSSQLSLG